MKIHTSKIENIYVAKHYKIAGMSNLKISSMPSLKLKSYTVRNKDGDILYVEEAEFMRLDSESFHVSYEILITEDEVHN